MLNRTYKAEEVCLMTAKTLLNIQCFPWTAMTFLPIILYLMLLAEETRHQGTQITEIVTRREEQWLSKLDTLIKVFLTAYVLSIARDVSSFPYLQVTDSGYSFPHIESTINGYWTLEFISDFNLLNSVVLVRNIIVLVLWKLLES